LAYSKMSMENRQFSEDAAMEHGQRRRDPGRYGFPNNNFKGYGDFYNNNNRGNWGGNNNRNGGYSNKRHQSFQRRGPRTNASHYDFSRNNHAASRERATVADRDRERQLYGSLGEAREGINFERYDKIPVEMSGDNCPEPCSDFQDSGLCASLLENITRCKYTKPTPVQRYSIPVILERRDLMACAQTGSGKTAAFLLPSIHMLLTTTEPSTLSGRNQIFCPSALVLAPTRELAQQTHVQAQRFLYMTGMRSCVIYGGSHINQQFHQMNGGVDVLVATPGRLYDMYDRGRLSLRNVQVLIMDEADRMLDMGFEPQIRQIVEECDMPPKGLGKRQTLMYSATFPLVIQKLAQDFLEKYVFLAVGRVGSTTDFIRQEVEYVPDWAKAGKLLELLPQFSGQKTLVFTQTKKGADELERFLTNHNHHVMVIHGDKNQRDRERALTQFRRGYCSILIATDVAARGLDIPDVKTVIQYDCPSHIDDYVHRIGRTGRCGNTGYALTFVNENSRPILIDLINIIRESNQDVPQWYVNMCGVVLQEKKKRNRFGARDIRRNNRNRNGNNNQRKHGGRRYDNNNSLGNRGSNGGGYQKNNHFGGRGHYNQRNNDQNYQNARQYSNKGHHAQQQTPGYAAQGHMQSYQTYNYAQTGFMGYPPMGAVPFGRHQEPRLS